MLLVSIARVLLVLALTQPAQPAKRHPQPAPAARVIKPGSSADRIPDTVVVALNIRGGAGRVESFQHSDFWTRVSAAPIVGVIKQTPQYAQAMTGLNVVRAMTGLTLWEMLAAGMGDDAVVALSPPAADRKQPGFLAVVRHGEARRIETVRTVLDKIHLAAGMLVDDKPDPDKTHEAGGVTVWEAQGGNFHAFDEGTLFLSNSKSLIDAAVALRNRTKGRLCDTAMWKRALETVTPDAPLWGVADLKAMRKMSPQEWRKAQPNPLAALLFSDWTARVFESSLAVAWLSADSSDFKIEGRLVTLAGESGGQTREAGSPVVLACQELPRGLAHFTLFRDFSEWWTTRENTMTENAVAEFGKFAGVMTTLIGGMDFSDEFLPHVLPGAQFLMARQTFESRPQPAPALPAFALVLRLKDAAKIGPRLDSAATMAISFINLDAGQKGMPTFLINIEDYRGHKVTWTQYPDVATASAPTDDSASPGRANVRYNFEPAMTRVGDRVVLATTRQFLRDIVDSIEKGAAAKAASKESQADEVYVSIPELKRILVDNRDQFVADQMLKRDISKKKARERIDALLGIADWFKDVSLRSHSDASHAEFSLRIGLAHSQQ